MATVRSSNGFRVWGISNCSSFRLSYSTIQYAFSTQQEKVMIIASLVRTPCTCVDMSVELFSGNWLRYQLQGGERGEQAYRTSSSGCECASSAISNPKSNMTRVGIVSYTGLRFKSYRRCYIHTRLHVTSTRGVYDARQNRSATTAPQQCPNLQDLYQKKSQSSP